MSIDNNRDSGLKETSGASSYFADKKSSASLGGMALKASAVLAVVLLAILAAYMYVNVDDARGPGVGGSGIMGGPFMSALVVVVAIVPTLLALSLMAHLLQTFHQKGNILLFLPTLAIFLGLLCLLVVEIYIYAVFSFEQTAFWQRHYRELSF